MRRSRFYIYLKAKTSFVTYLIGFLLLKIIRNPYIKSVLLEHSKIDCIDIIALPIHKIWSHNVIITNLFGKGYWAKVLGLGWPSINWPLTSHRARYMRQARDAKRARHNRNSASS